MKEKIYILDTSVILYDHNAYKKFKKNDIILPSVVLEEIDQFKKGNETINFEAREFTRVIDRLSEDFPLNDWIPIGTEDLGRMKVSFELHDATLDAEHIFQEEKNDHKILNVALYYYEQFKQKEVILVSKDVNLRVKAKSLGLKAQDYQVGVVKNISSLYTGKQCLENINEELIEKFYKEKKLHIKELNIKEEILYNSYYIIRNGNKSALGFYGTDENIYLINKKSVSGIKPKNAEQIFAINSLLDPDIKIVSISGVAGTGKTLIAMASAIEQKKNFQQIYIARPIVPLNNKDIGYLPGDVDSKIGPYMQPIYDCLSFIKDQMKNNHSKELKKINNLTENDKIVVSPLAYIRGRSLHNIVFIVDEAQNLSPIEIKTIITRMGENSKIVFTGDIFQIDNPWLDEKSNGLSYMIDKLKGEKIYSHVTLEKGERSETATLAADKL